MARVFLATDPALGRRVVVKVLPAEPAQGCSAERFARKIKLAAALHDPHIVPLLSAFTRQRGECVSESPRPGTSVVTRSDNAT